MTAHDTFKLQPPITLSALLVVALAAVSTLLAASPQGAADGVEVRTVSAAAQPCLNLRESPSYRARIIGCIEIGSELIVSGAENGWSRVSTESEGQGWVETKLLDPPSAAASAPAPEAGSDPMPGSEVAGLIAERDSLAERLSAAGARIAELEDQLTRRTLAEDGDSSRREETLAELDRVRISLAVAEQRTAELEAEARRQAPLAESVARLTAERDLLASDLARAEARKLYLQSDLETTRAELMQLKGIPPKLVMPRLEPAAVTLPPIEPEPATIAQSNGDEREADLGRELGLETHQADEVTAAVRAWAEAWSSQRVDDYLAFYAADFRPADGQDRSSWEQSRRQRIAAPRSIEIALDRISPTVSAGNAIVLFQQTYVSESFTDVVYKTLVMERIDGIWRIVEERVNR